MIRAALFARYSSDLQSAASIEDQFWICRDHAERAGWTVVDTYRDAAMSVSHAAWPNAVDGKVYTTGVDTGQDSGELGNVASIECDVDALALGPAVPVAVGFCFPQRSTHAPKLLRG